MSIPPPSRCRKPSHDFGIGIRHVLTQRLVKRRTVPGDQEAEQFSVSLQPRAGHVGAQRGEDQANLGEELVEDQVEGKTNLKEYAYGVSGYNPYSGAMLTPADTSRAARGSSGGSSVAVAVFPGRPPGGRCSAIIETTP
jgi:hypothetical protein